MKKCPTCDKTFEDSMRFCQADGTPLVDDVPAFDPYATIVAQPRPPIEEPAAAEPEIAAEPVADESVVEAVIEPEPAPGQYVAAEPEAAPEPAVASEPEVVNADAYGDIPDVTKTVGSLPIGEPEDVLDLPAEDPLRTVFVSDDEMQQALAGDGDDKGQEIIEVPAYPEPPAPEPPTFSVPDVPAPSFGEMPPPPPSPFAPPASPVVELSPIEDDEPETVLQPSYEPAPPPFLEPPAAPYVEPPPPVFTEPEPSYQPVSNSPFEQPPPAPVAEWTPPPAPDAGWQNQQIGANTPFQPPPAGTGSLNQTLPIISLVLGIVSLCCYISPLTGIAALITGYLGMKNANNDPANYGGKGLAMAGMIVGGIFFVMGIAYWIYIIFFIGLAALGSFSR